MTIEGCLEALSEEACLADSSFLLPFGVHNPSLQQLRKCSKRLSSKIQRQPNVMPFMITSLLAASSREYSIRPAPSGIWLWLHHRPIWLLKVGDCFEVLWRRSCQCASLACTCASSAGPHCSGKPHGRWSDPNEHGDRVHSTVHRETLAQVGYPGFNNIVIDEATSSL